MLGSARAGDDGFSLVELMVVLAILGLAAALAGPAMLDLSGRRTLQRSATELSALLRRARAEAALSGADSSVTLHLVTRTVAASWTDMPLTLPADLAVTALSARDEILRADQAQFRFFADGSATGGTLRLKLKRSRMEIGVDWLTGRVEQSGPSS